jgi:hypothetical protein
MSRPNHPLVFQIFRNITVDDPLGKALNNRRLAHTGLPIRTGLFLGPLERDLHMRRISSSRPMTGQRLLFWPIH